MLPRYVGSPARWLQTKGWQFGTTLQNFVNLLHGHWMMHFSTKEFTHHQFQPRGSRDASEMETKPNSTQTETDSNFTGSCEQSQQRPEGPQRWLKLRPGGPKAIRTPDMLSGVPNLTPEETQRLQDSATLLDRCVNSVSVTYSSGGHGHLEQPSGAMSWSEDCTQDWIPTFWLCTYSLSSLCFSLEYHEDMALCFFISTAGGFSSYVQSWTQVCILPLQV